MAASCTSPLDDRTYFYTVPDPRKGPAYKGHAVDRGLDSFYRRDFDTVQLGPCLRTDSADVHRDRRYRRRDAADCRDVLSQSQSGAALTPFALRLVGHIPLIFLFTGSLSR